MKKSYGALIVSLLIVLFLGIIFLVKNPQQKIDQQEVAQKVSHQELDSKDEAFETFKNSFLYQEKPVHPEVIERFIGFWVSDDWQPKTISMDISACPDTNEFYKDFKWSCSDSDNEIYCSLERGEDAGFFHYTWLGKLNNGLHVVKTMDNWGGRMTMQALIFFKISKGCAFDPKGEVYSPILLTFVRNYCWYDGDLEIKVLNDKVLISFYREDQEPAEVILDFPSHFDFN
jgi:hypothetical protein